MTSMTTIAAAARRDLAGLEGRLIGPDDAGYDEARAVYNAMIDRRPALSRAAAGADDIAGAVEFAREQRLLLASAAAATTAPAWAPSTTAWSSTSRRMRGVRVDPQARTVRVGGGCTWGDVDHATHAFGLADPERHHLDDRRRRAHARRRHRPPHPQVRADHRQPARGRDGARRRHASRERRRASRPVLGDPRRRRQLRRGHLVPLPPAPVGTVFGGPDALAARATRPRCMRCYREFMPAAPRELNGFFAFLTVPPAARSRRSCTDARCAASSGATPGSEEDAAAGDRAAARRRAGAAACTASRRCRTRRCRASSTRSTRRATSGTGGPTSSTRSPTRRVDLHVRFGAELPTLEVDDAPVPDRRRGARRRHVRHGLELSRRQLGAGHRRRRPRPGERGRDPALDASATARRCIPTRRAAPT